jgi:hypothetical protein
MTQLKKYSAHIPAEHIQGMRKQEILDPYRKKSRTAKPFNEGKIVDRLNPQRPRRLMSTNLL